MIKMADHNVNKLHRKERFVTWLQTPHVSVYLMKALSSWGDRMWMFAVGLYLVKLSNVTLTLTAIYGLTGGVCVILLGALLGDWVDRNPRLKVARMSLVIQNSSVIVCAVILGLVISLYDEILRIWPVHLANICSALVIATAVVSKLASIATKIAVEKDWVVVMCSEDKDKLSTMNASMRRIDLLCNILAPVLVGQILTFISMVIGAVVIAAWNLISVFLEYYLLWRIYEAVPNLAVKGRQGSPVEKKTQDSKEPAQPETEELIKGGNQDDVKPTTVRPKMTLFELVFGRFISIYRGWGIYFRQSVLPAGVAFACEFLTVLAFDNITSGYAYSQGLTESVIGILMAAGAVTGIAGTFVFPVLRHRLGLEKTGIIAFVVFIGCLSLCVISIWAEGSPFDPSFSKNSANSSVCSLALISNHSQGQTTFNGNESSINPVNVSNAICETPSISRSYLSVSLLMAGIVTARFGLWLSDLTITQVFQENVVEAERGVVNGVQSSLNMLMDVIRYTMVVIAPRPETYGILVIISFLSICIGACSFVYYTWKRNRSMPTGEDPADLNLNPKCDHDTIEKGDNTLNDKHSSLENVDAQSNPQNDKQDNNSVPLEEVKNEDDSVVSSQQQETKSHTATIDV